MAGKKCPRCIEAEYLDPLELDDKAFARSRRDGRKICIVCGKAEALEDFMKGALTFRMAYTHVYGLYEEAIRLPPGVMWPPAGMTQFPTGGLHDVPKEKVHGSAISEDNRNRSDESD